MKDAELRDMLDQFGLDYIRISGSYKDPMDAEREQFKELDKVAKKILSILPKEEPKPEPKTSLCDSCAKLCKIHPVDQDCPFYMPEPTVVSPCNLKVPECKHDYAVEILTQTASDGWHKKKVVTCKKPLCNFFKVIYLGGE